MKKITFCLVLVGLLVQGLPAAAEVCTIDDVPAATLLLPYFEVDLVNLDCINTLFSINNASAAAAIAHVTLWTDQSIPTLDFDVYLTGYDVQTISVRDLFNGRLPVTADRGADAGSLATADTLSPSPPPGTTQASNVNPYTGPFVPGVPTEFDYPSPPSTTGPCVAPYTNPVLDNFRLTNLIAAHRGQNAPAYGGCLGANYGDNLVRGYITVDSVTQCNLFFPSSANYFDSNIADTRNVLWGDYLYVDPVNNSAQGETLVHIESCSVFPPGPPPFTGFVGNGGRRPAGGPWCPFAPGEYTFYGRYAALAGQDQREPLATTFASRFVNGGTFDGGTDLIVWRDSKTIPVAANGPYNCATDNGPGWFPLNQQDVVAFDEMENPQDLCSTTCNFSPCDNNILTCFPLETQRVRLPGGNVIGSNPTPSATFGWMYLNLNTAVTGVNYPADPNIAQAWVTAVMSASGRFSVGFDAVQLDSACQPRNTVFLAAP